MTKEESVCRTNAALIHVDKSYFHVTTPEAWTKIQKEGLVPQIGERSMEIGEPLPAVFLFESEEAMNDALGSWLGAEFEDDEPLVALEVKPPAGMPLDEGVSCPWEARCYDVIPPECITMYDNDI